MRTLTAAALAALLSGQTVTVKLKPKWRVKKVNQLRISDGTARYRVTALVRNQAKVAVRVRVQCRTDQADLPPVPDTNRRTDVYSKDLSSGFVQLVSATAAGTQGDGSSETFSSAPRNWSPDDTRLVPLRPRDRVAKSRQ